MKINKLKILFIKLFPSLVGKRPAMAWAAAFLFSLVLVLVNEYSGSYMGGSLTEFEVGKVADRDVSADQAFVYVDEVATRLRYEAVQQLVPAVFHYSSRVTEDTRNRWNRFVDFVRNNSPEGHSTDVFRLAVQSEFPGDFSDEVLDQLYLSQDLGAVLRDCTAILDSMLEKGIFSVPQAEIARLNPDIAELIRQSGSRIEQERVPLRNIATLGTAVDAVKDLVSAGTYPPSVVQLAPGLLKPFMRENVFYSTEDTERRMADNRARTEPVLRNIEQGRRIIRKGFVITEDDFAELTALRKAIPKMNLALAFSDTLFLLLLFGLLCFFCGRRIIGRPLTNRETYVVAALSALYISGGVLVKNVPLEFIPVSVMVPTALIVMLPAILIHPRLALLFAMSLPLGAYLTGSFNTASYVFALVSGVVAAYSLQGAEKRMDLVRAGLVIAVANVIAMTSVLLWQHGPAWAYARALFWAAFNGIASGMLVLGVLPPLEHALNTATTFRLVELSDLNTPVLRRLFTTAPGTYSHSIMVANLAEAACQDIGANPLLARVGAYYHDLGKMENPDYFVENQAAYNRHDDMAPRLSATVIRSHVKLGIEKARQLALPQEVIDIIGEHHGNSLITWFYSKALKQESAKGVDGENKKNPVDSGDFRYIGNPPRSRESAVVMLADVTEAAARTLEKPTAVKLEKFIHELISKKVEHGQLNESELTFRDLETIKKAFVRVLAGYYHSRIEYPKIDDDKNPPETQDNGGKKDE